MDLADKYKLPHAINVGVLQGGWFDYADCNPCPDAFLWGGTDESSSLGARSRKIYRMFKMITGGISVGAGAVENKVRAANGIAPYEGEITD